MKSKVKIEKEIWKDIKNYEGLYQVSNISHVINGRNKRAGGYKWKIA